MAIRLTTGVNNSVANVQRRNLFVQLNILNNMDIGASLTEFNLNFTQAGGSFRATIAMVPGAPSFVENQYVTVFSRGSDSFTGIIEKPGFNVGGEGAFRTYSGTIVTPGIRRNLRASFETADPYLLNGSVADNVLANSNVEVSFSNYYRLFGMSALRIMQIMSSITGVPVVPINVPFDYPVNRYVVDQNRLYSAVEDLAKYAGANAIVRSASGIQGIYVLGWNATMTNHSYDFWETIGGVTGEFEKSEFDAVIVQSSSEMTPYNSTFAGPPEQITTIAFEAGQHSLTDLGHTVGSTSTQDSWFYPYSPGNQWVRHTSDGFASNMMLNFGSPVWDVKTLASRIDYNSVVSNIMGSVYSDTAVGFSTSYEVTEYEVLLRWNKAVMKLTNLGDVYPYLFMIPGNAPSYLTTFNVNTDVFSVDLMGKTDFPVSSVLADCPAQFTVNLPSFGTAVPLYNSPDISMEGYAEDGTAYIGLYPRPAVGVEEIVTFDPTVREDSLHKFKYTRAVLQGKPKTNVDPSETRVDPATSNKNVNLSNATDYDPDTGNSASVGDRSMRITITEGTDAQKKERIKKILDRIAHRGLDVVVIPYGDYFRSLDVRSIAMSSDKLAIIIMLNKAVRYDYDGTLYMSDKAMSENERDTSPKEKASYSNTYVNLFDSGFVNQRANTPLKGEWTLYGLKRRTYPVTAIASTKVSDVTLIFNNQSYELLARNPKTVSSSLITDSFRGTMENTHLYKFASFYASYLSQDFTSFSFQVYDDGSALPQVGDSVTLNNVPYVGVLTGKVTSVTLSVTPSSGSLISIQCGRLELP